MKPLTEKQREALAAAAKGGLSPWDWGSSVIARLKREGLVAPVRGRHGGTEYAITETGARVLGKEAG